MFSILPPIPAGTIRVHARDVDTDVSQFDKILTAEDTDVQKALENIDEISVDGGEFGSN